jgi:RHS repeat-associated protein
MMSVTSTINGQSRNQTFRYDQVSRVTYAGGSDAGGAWQRGYEYDRWGNRKRVMNLITGLEAQHIDLQQAFGVPITNRPTRVWNTITDFQVGLPQSYDACGNLTDDGDNAHQFDAENRLIRTTPVGGGGQIEYLYDAGNQRVKKVAGASGTHYVWEGGRVIAEYNAATGTLLAEYIYVSGRMIAQESSGTVKYFHQDRLSTRMITNANGSWAGTMSHQAFGEQGAESGEQNKHRFTSYDRDAESGTDYAVNRQYSPPTGRFMQPDPVAGDTSNPQGLNRYAYVRNNPVNLTDPSGLVTCDATVRTCNQKMGFWPSDLDFWGYRIVDLPGFGTKWGSMSQLEEWRYSVLVSSGWRFDPAFQDAEDDGLEGLDQETVDACRKEAFGDSDTAGELYIGKLRGKDALRIARLILYAGGEDTTLSAMVGAIWAKESQLEFRPTGDNGPMQVTGYWRRNFPYLIEPGSFDPFTRKKNDQRTFTGNVKANVLTGGNIITWLYNNHVVYLRQRLGSIPYMYGPGKNPPRSVYEKQVMSAYPLFEKFVRCLKNSKQ